MTPARVILRPRRGESPADLCRDLMAISNGSGLTIRSFAGGFLVDDKTALAYLGLALNPDGEPATSTPAAPPPPPPDPPAPQTEPGSTADPTSTTTNPDGDTPPAKARRVPRRGAAMKETGHAV